MPLFAAIGSGRPHGLSSRLGYSVTFHHNEILENPSMLDYLKMFYLLHYVLFVLLDCRNGQAEV